MLQITFANRFETLRDTLLENIGAPMSPFDAEQIIIPSSAVRRDLTLAISRHYGICANVEFSYLARWLWAQIAKVVPSVATESPFAAPVMTWRILQIFDDSTFVGSFPRLAGYLKQADPVVRHDFATRVAGLLEQYMTYRPGWLAAWSAGKLVPIKNAPATAEEDQAWQAALWRTIAAQVGAEREHPAVRFLEEVEALGAEAPRQFGLPVTAHVFCLPTMPPLYIDILRQLGRWIDLRLYVLNPCREFWFDIVDQPRLSYLTARGKADYHELGNPLLANWGQQTKAHIELLLEHSGDALVDDGGFSENTGDSILAHVQRSILNLTAIEPGSILVQPDDRSVEFHVCHSLTRELEVLQDQILSLFATDSPPSPAEILVVTPDLEAAAPLIEAVFANAPPERIIPYTVTGRARSTINGPARALLALLSLASSRFPASAVFNLLQQPIVGRRFGIAGDDLEAIQRWIVESGIRWGIDGSHRAQFNLPAVERYSFDDGLHRLFLGYALPEDVSRPLNGRVPAGNTEGSGAAVLGRFWLVVDELSRLRHELTRTKKPEEWMGALFDVIDDFLAPTSDDIDDLGYVRESIRELHDHMTRGGITAPVTLDVVRAALEGLLDDPAKGGVPTGRVTFSSMSSLRMVPYRFIYAIGLNDGAFPSTVRPAEFDLIALTPQLGDRQRRVDERNLFLDLLLAARERFSLSYTGRSIRDNASLPASVLVSELIEILVPATCTDPSSAALRTEARKRLVIEHPLQPFAASYFASDADSRIRSFNREMCEALRKGLAKVPEVISEIVEDVAGEDDEDVERESLPKFFSLPLSEPGVEWREVSLDGLIRFFSNPCRFLLRERLGIELSAAESELVDEEPFLADFQGRQALGERLLPHYRAGMDDEDLRALALAGVEYPSGAFGDSLIDQELASLKEFASSVRQAEATPCLPPYHGRVSVDLDGEAWHLNAAFADLRPSGLIRQRYDDTRATDYLGGWLSHLFLCAARPEGVTLETEWLSRNGRYRLHRCDEAGAILGGLLRLYRRGLREPIHFFPKSAWKYICSDNSLYQAESAWRSTRDRPWGEEEHPAYRLALRGAADPIDADFNTCAETVFGPMRAYLEGPRI
jgi:exodeoxyribonuclease V gamma subunit